MASSTFVEDEQANCERENPAETKARRERQEWSIDRCISSRDSKLTYTEKQRFSSCNILGINFLLAKIF